MSHTVNGSEPAGTEARLDLRYRAVIQRDGPWWVGWVEEIPGVNSQARSREELLENLRSALKEALEMNRAEAIGAVTGEYEEAVLVV